MRHYRLYMLLLLSAFTQCTNAQKKVLLNGSLSPNKVYKTEMNNQMNMVMNMSGDSAMMEQLSASGMKSPMTMTMNQGMFMTTKTGATQADKKIPVTITYDKMSVTTNIGGQENTQETNPFSDAVIKGTTEGDGKIKVDTIIGNLDEGMRANLKTIVNNIQAAIKFPENELKIGDSFDQETPLVMPIAQMQVKMKVHAKYTLKEIKGSKAIFDLKQDIAMDMSMTDTPYKITGTGSGTGVMIFDIDKKMMDKSDADTKYKIDMEINGMKMDMDCNAKTSVKMEVE
ncbi:MAG: hypothetical protein H6Q26_572 [Bacteroidetes bacterium]|uniref:hypothetical protein n=1 Tax=Chitinophaga sp. LS1 TaxID=3051176 RepID=UPI001DF9CD56|nr:hypothetical protein [Chitinophaga sp. LS1]MBP1650415.1 hypothetical protein [Bacteroidota bacterium]WPV70481.1 hypothetical protein QQL36_17370 [Chitinophaga sp. LS1]